MECPRHHRAFSGSNRSVPSQPVDLLSLQLKEVYELLSANYVEDDQAAFRFRYTAEFLEWYAQRLSVSASVSVSDPPTYRALKPPGWQKEWHTGVRVSSNKKLVAFISGVPIHLRVRHRLIFFRPSTLVGTDVPLGISVRLRSIISACTRNYDPSVSRLYSSKKSLDDVTSRASSKQSTRQGS
jgi:hypothetical protein